jgi:hypothetical protein
MNKLSKSKKEQSSIKTQKSSHTQKSKDKKLDLCPVCDVNLYCNEEYTNRCGIVDDDGTIIGWMCPKCRTEFDLSNRPSKIIEDNYMRGEA